MARVPVQPLQGLGFQLSKLQPYLQSAIPGRPQQFWATVHGTENHCKSRAHSTSPMTPAPDPTRDHPLSENILVEVLLAISALPPPQPHITSRSLMKLSPAPLRGSHPGPGLSLFIPSAHEWPPRSSGSCAQDLEHPPLW